MKNTCIFFLLRVSFSFSLINLHSDHGSRTQKFFIHDSFNIKKMNLSLRDTQLPNCKIYGRSRKRTCVGNMYTDLLLVLFLVVLSGFFFLCYLGGGWGGGGGGVYLHF